MNGTDFFSETGQRIAKHLCKRILPVLLLLMGFGLPAQAAGVQQVELSLPTGLVATARYQPGDKPRAVLLLHGLLQTNNYLTVSSLINALSEQGYTVLAPTLSLGVNRRRQSLECSAIHAHSLQEDVAEVSAWIAWLEQHGHQDIVLLGHSFGSLELLAYAAGKPSSSVKHLIATSLVDLEHQLGDAFFLQQLEQARNQSASGDARLHEYSISYCKRYVAPAEAFLSYADWPRSRLLKTLADNRVPTKIILGSADARMHPDWPVKLQNQGVKVAIIEGAGHFFDSQYEFDLVDEVLAILDNKVDG